MPGTISRFFDGMGSPPPAAAVFCRPVDARRGMLGGYVVAMAIYMTRRSVSGLRPA